MCVQVAGLPVNDCASIAARFTAVASPLHVRDAVAMGNFFNRSGGDGRGLLMALCCAVLLSACGGGSGGTGSSNAGTAPGNSNVGTDGIAAVGADLAPLTTDDTGQGGGPVASAITELDVTLPTLPDDVASQFARPAFHVAPVILDPPDDTDRDDSSASARMAPRSQAVPAALEGMPTRGLTLPAMKSAMRRGMVRDPGAHGPGTSASPSATPAAVAIYSPAQIRAAYDLPTLPVAGAALTAAQAAQLGAGQTIYIVDAQNDPHVAAELAVFNNKFGLSACSVKTIATDTPLPLASASTNGCELAIAYSSVAGAVVATPPAYDAAWATEIALDVQWAHATAPLARIVLIEAPDATLKSLLGAVKLANAMGPGVVSMSFGSPEGSWTTAVDAAFAVPGMTYLAASGDTGAGVEWPSVSANVLAVGGTTLTYSGSGQRSETSWSGTGGGVSQFVPTPAYQTPGVPGVGSSTHRAVADVAFNADPASGQFVATVPPGGIAVGWVSAGGTSLATPQWAGIVAIGNAQRALAARPLLGVPHALLYGQIATVPGTYASAFSDVIAGADGTCASCFAKVGYDTLSGLGTPNVSNLLTVIGGAASTSAAPVAPIVLSAKISGKAGIPLTFTASVHSAGSVTYALTGAPPGMSIGSGGAVSWAVPLAGTYRVTVIATDPVTGVSGSGVCTVVIAAPRAAQPVPIVTPASISGQPDVALVYATSVTSSAPVTYSLVGAPSGMAISTAGVITWAAPVAGSYAVTVTARDSKTGLGGAGHFAVRITAGGPVITAPAIAGIVGQPVRGAILIADPDAKSLVAAISGAPMGMTFMLDGGTIKLSWAEPVAGNYTLRLSVVDTLGLSAQTTVPVSIAIR
jgi:hypothetical protein